MSSVGNKYKFLVGILLRLLIVHEWPWRPSTGGAVVVTNSTETNDQSPLLVADRRQDGYKYYIRNSF